MSVNTIRPSEMATQITTMNAAINADNDGLERICDSVIKLSEESELKGASWEAMKELYSNHNAVIKAIILANKAFKAANTSVSSQIGDEELSRIQIQNNIDRLQKSINTSNSILKGIQSLSYVSAAAWSIKKGIMQRISLNRETIECLKEKLEKMDQIENGTNGLYEEAISLYGEAKKGLELLRSSWDGTQYVSSGNSDWASGIFMKWDQKELEERMGPVLDRIAKKDENGNVIGYDYAELGRIIEKSPDDISEAEYAALSYIAATTDDPNLLKIIVNGCYKSMGEPKEVKDGMDITSVIVESERTSKLDKILQGISTYESGLYVIADVSQEEGDKLYKMGAFGRVEQNKVIFEHLAAGPNIIAGVSRRCMGGPWQILADSTINITKDERGNFTLKYCDGDRRGDAYASYESDVHEVTISQMEVGNNCADEGSKQDIQCYANNVGASTSYSQAIQKIPENVLNDMIESIASAAAPADMILTACEKIQGIVKTNQEIKTYESTIHLNDCERMIRYLKLYSVRITDKIDGQMNVSYQIARGVGDGDGIALTEQCLENFNKNLSESGKYEELGKEIGYDSEKPITMDDIYNNQERIIALQEKLEIVLHNGKGNSPDVEEIYRYQDNNK